MGRWKTTNAGRSPEQKRAGHGCKTADLGKRSATNVAMEAEKYGPVHIGASDSSAPDSDQEVVQVPAPADGTRDGSNPRKAPPPRVRKPSPIHDQFLAPTPDLAGYRARFREAFGDTMSDEFVDVMLGKVIEALKPSPFDQLDELTLNAALAIIDSVRCRSELEAFIAVEIVARGSQGFASCAKATRT